MSKLNALRTTLLALVLGANLTLTGCFTLAGVALDAATDGDGTATVVGASADLAILGAALDSDDDCHHEHFERYCHEHHRRDSCCCSCR